MSLATETADILIVGGGLTGAALACALADGARRIVVLEARAGRGARFAGELIHPPGVDVLAAHGLLEPLRAAGGVDIQGFAVAGAPGRDALHLSYAEIPGGRAHALAMDHHEMVGVLRRAAEARPGVSVRFGARVVDVEREGDRIVGVRTDAGQTLRAGLTLVAEGRHSRLRHRLGLDEPSRLVSYTAAVLVDEAELPHGRAGHIFLGAPGPILAYPIGGARVRMCLDLPELPDGPRGTANIAARLRDHYAPLIPEPLRARLLASLAARPLEVAANHAISTRRCVVPGAALVGESGGCSHPLTASGMTVCLHDVRLLAEELGRPDRAAALSSYQARRYRFVRAREVLADALYEVFRADTDGTRAIREGLFRYWDGDARARAASLALLSGHESRLPSFLGEYLRVVGYGVERSLRGAVPGNRSSVGGRVQSLRGLVGKSLEKLDRVVAHAREGALW